MTPLRFGVDVGGTRLKFAAVRDGRVICRHVEPTPRAGVAALVTTLAGGCGTLASAVGESPTSIGLGVAGVLSDDGARVLQSPNMPWLDGAPLAELLATALAVPVRAENDANCIGWGEARAGAGEGARRVACLALGTGLGGALVLDGWLLRGGRGRGGELGHLIVQADGPACGCGGRGCAEQFASQTGIARMAAETGWVGGLGLTPAALVPALLDAARSGDAIAAGITDRVGVVLGTLGARLDALFGLDRLIIAGGLCAGLDLFAPAALRAAAALGDRPLPPLVAAALGGDGGPVGAAMLFDAPQVAATGVIAEAAVSGRVDA